jgi:hypothetical protein
LQFIPSLSAAKARDQWGSRDRGQFDAAMTTAIEWKVTAICSADPSLRSG